ncbi:MAG: MBL fold metallo-hydrolase [Bacteriovoracaceae bacterium]|nr:MBL fold metallo-hydrolase [Bacteriovoracaceae bacterium]
MKVTFLAHQGWLFEGSNGSKVLLDPLYERMGNGNTRLDVWPNRTLNLEKIGKIDAVIISHEHADHFDIESLFKIRDICKPDTVYVPDISTRAIKNALKEMKFNVKELESLEKLNIGNLELTPLPSVKSRFEPDVYSFLVEDIKTKGSFYTPIDTIPTELTITYLEEYCPNRTIDNYTNNFVQRIYKLHNLDNNIHNECFDYIYSFLQRYIDKFSPKEVLISGQGWAYPKEMSEHNELMFCVSHDDLVEKGEVDYKNINFNVAGVGTTYEIIGDKFSENRDHADYCEMKESLNRQLDTSKFETYDLLPYCKRINEKEGFVQETIEYIENKLGSIISLGANKLNKALYYQIAYPQDDYRGLYLELREGSESWQFEFSYSDSCFYKLSEKFTYEEAKEKFAFGMIGFMYDFHEIIYAREEAHLVSENSMYVWNNREDLLNEATDIDFMNCFRPQYRPIEFEKFYIEEIKKYET